jgi:hypothetical protein
MTYRKRNDDPSLTVTPMAAANLIDLPTGGSNVVQVGNPVVDGDVTIYTFRSTFTVAASPKGFMMLDIAP